MSTLDILKAARAKIEKPENWTQGHLALRSDGRIVGPDNPEAVCWCAEGAIRAVSRKTKGDFNAAYAALQDALPSQYVGYVHVFNDDICTAHGGVLSVFDRAIAKLEKAP